MQPRRLPLFIWLWGLCLAALLCCVGALIQQRQQAARALEAAQQQLQSVRQLRQQRSDYAAELAWIQTQQLLYRPFVSLSKQRGIPAPTQPHAQALIQAAVRTSLVAAFQQLQHSAARPAMHYVIHPAMACRGADCGMEGAAMSVNSAMLDGVQVAVDLSWQINHEAALLQWLIPLQARFSGQMQLLRCHWQTTAETVNAPAASLRPTPLTAECQLRWVFFPALAAWLPERAS